MARVSSLERTAGGFLLAALDPSMRGNPDTGRSLRAGRPDRGRPGDFRFFIDPATLFVDEKGVVRYVLVARSRSGVENVSYEALRCEAAQHRVYALGRPDGTWSRSRTDWRPLEPGTRQLELYADYFCPQKVPIHNAAEGVSALQDGGHPFAKGFGGDWSKDRR